MPKLPRRPRTPFGKEAKRLQSELLRDLKAREPLHTALADVPRLRAFAYFAEKKGLGREFANCFENTGKQALERLVLSKGVAKPFLICLKRAGGERVGKALKVAGGVQVGRALKVAGGERVGKALKVAGSERVGRALKVAGGVQVGKALVKNFDKTVATIEAGNFNF